MGFANNTQAFLSFDMPGRAIRGDTWIDRSTTLSPGLAAGASIIGLGHQPLRGSAQLQPLAAFFWGPSGNVLALTSLFKTAGLS